MGIVDVERYRRGIVRLVMRQETARNAMGEDLRRALLEALTDLLADRQVRVIVVASGLKDFSVGAAVSTSRPSRSRSASPPMISRKA